MFGSRDCKKHVLPKLSWTVNTSDLQHTNRCIKLHYRGQLHRYSRAFLS